MRKTKWTLKALAMACLLAVCICAVPAATVLAVEDLDEQIERLRAELGEINSNIAELEGDIANSAEVKRQYELQQAVLEELLAANSESISATETAILQKQAEIGEKIQSVYEQQEKFEERMVAVYKNRNESMLSTLLSVNSFSELLTVTNSLQRITKHDTELIQTLSDEKEALELERQELERLVADLDAKNAEHEQGIQQLAVNISAQDSTISDLEAQKEAEEAVGSTTEDELNRMIAERAEQERAAAELAEAARRAEEQRKADEEQRRAEEEERRRQQEEKQNNEGGEGEEGEEGGEGNEEEPPPPEPEVPQHNGSVYVWPVPGHSNVTCEFGSPDPDGKGHRGMDINDGSIRGATVVAAGPGTVLVAGWNSSWGNYVSIDHGQGLVTLYAHLEGYTVSAGQYVEAGAMVGKVGNTGFVVGANGGYHLHFEVMLNGGLQNPRNYVSP